MQRLTGFLAGGLQSHRRKTRQVITREAPRRLVLELDVGNPLTSFNQATL